MRNEILFDIDTDGAYIEFSGRCALRGAPNTNIGSASLFRYFSTDVPAC